MKKLIITILIGLVLATTVGFAEQAADKPGMMGGMMQGMKGMMSDQQSGEQPHGMKEMMSRMSQMTDMCSRIMGNASQSKKEESNK